jgi:hypothetical protein
MVIHMPTGTAHANWPTYRTLLNNVVTVALLAISNYRGHVLLYALNHYTL